MQSQLQRPSCTETQGGKIYTLLHRELHIPFHQQGEHLAWAAFKTMLCVAEFIALSIASITSITRLLRLFHLHEYAAPLCVPSEVRKFVVNAPRACGA